MKERRPFAGDEYAESIQVPEGFVAPTQEELLWNDNAPLANKRDFFIQRGIFYTAYWCWAKVYSGETSISTVLGRLFPVLVADRKQLQNTIMDAFYLQRKDEGEELRKKNDGK